MMFRTTLSRALVVALLAAPHAALAAQAAPAAQARKLAPADAAPFMGDWTLELQGPNGPGTFLLSVKTEKDAVVAEIGNDTLPKQPITDISRDKDSLVLGYSFNYEGNAVDAVVTLKPAQDGKTAAQIDFAGGAYVMTGTATKKPAGK